MAGRSISDIALLTFTNVPACMVAELLIAALLHRGASVHVVASTTRPGCYHPTATIVGWELNALGKRAFPRRTELCSLVRLGRMARMADTWAAEDIVRADGFDRTEARCPFA